MNFCFWPDNPSGEFEYINITKNLEKVLDSEPEFFTIDRLTQVTEQEIRTKVFDDNASFCLMDERARLVRQLGIRLREKNLSFLEFVLANQSCPLLVKALVDTFEGFRDQAIFRGRQVYFYKRAQILCADLIGAYDDYKAVMPDADVPQLTD